MGNASNVPIFFLLRVFSLRKHTHPSSQQYQTVSGVWTPPPPPSPPLCYNEATVFSGSKMGGGRGGNLPAGVKMCFGFRGADKTEGTTTDPPHSKHRTVPPVTKTPGEWGRRPPDALFPSVCLFFFFPRRRSFFPRAARQTFFPSFSTLSW